VRGQRGGERIAEHDAIAAVGQILDAAAVDVLCEPDRQPLLLRLHAAYGGAGRVLAMHQQRLGFDVRRRGQHLRHLQRIRLIGTPVLERAVQTHERRVRGDAQYAGLELALKPVHDREHDDQHCHTDCQSEHRHHGYERKKAAPLCGAQIARAQHPFVTPGHAIRSAKRRPAA
jgi:hypothetical protein